LQSTTKSRAAADWPDFFQGGRCASTYRKGLDGAAPAPSLATLERREPPRLSLVVLPFANIGGDPEQEHFVDGVTESLTTDLSRIRGSFVIGRNTAFTHKGKPVDLKQIGRELNVCYILEGSVLGRRVEKTASRLLPIPSGKGASHVAALHP
jgi:TolB-like protein